MTLTELSPIRLADLYNEYWCLMQAAQIDLHQAMRDGDDLLAASCRRQVKGYRQKTDAVKAEMERRRKNE